ncbi:SGNH/GDSL hydrolase family protein [Nostoc sp. TCL26-01]|uniref:SGNH/GDSL hydrolase family protein n=1 Tax=Nostoc sp. TCL26-01 TaxID=2576904 RepID=UPI0015C0DB4C|nr:SGNH/GDSL hydrolase family protein [Nostoc sp. TCL26-01]
MMAVQNQIRSLLSTSKGVQHPSQRILWSRWVNLGLALGLQFCLPMSCVTAATKIKVMSLGDSLCANNITVLRQTVAATKFGSTIDWVGTKKDSKHSDRDNECHGGWSAAQVWQKSGANIRLPGWEKQPGSVRDWVQKTKPDVVLVMLGTNDFFGDKVRGDKTSGLLKESLPGIIDSILSIRPQAAVVVASIPPFKWDIQKGVDQNKTKTTANEFLKQYISQLSAQKKRIFFVDMHTAIINQSNQENIFSPDGVHLNNQGNKLIAEEWSCALKTVLQGGSKPIIPANCSR